METTVEAIQLDYFTIQNVAKTLRAVNHKLRQQILKFIDENRHTDVTNIYVKLRLEQSVASQHLAILRNANIIKAERNGRNIYYSLNDNWILKVAAFVDDITIQEFENYL